MLTNHENAFIVIKVTSFVVYPYSNVLRENILLFSDLWFIHIAMFYVKIFYCSVIFKRYDSFDR